MRRALTGLEARLHRAVAEEANRVFPGAMGLDAVGRRGWVGGFWRLRGLRALFSPLAVSPRFLGASLSLLALSAMRAGRVALVWGSPVAVIFFFLAQMALWDAARATRTDADPVIAQTTERDGATLLASAGPDGAARVYRNERLIGVVRGHGASIVAVAFIDDDSALLTMDSVGQSRVTRLEDIAALNAIEIAPVIHALRRGLWDPYLAPIARQALFATAQVLPLAIPEELRGQRRGAFRDCTECPEMIELTGGAFLMGSPLFEQGRTADEGPRRLTEVAPFTVSRFEVTLSEWDACVAAAGCARNLEVDAAEGERSSRPAIVSWEEAQAFVIWLSARTGRTYRLPSETEWEYSARAGTTAPTAPRLPQQQRASQSNDFGISDDPSVAEWTDTCFAPDAAFDPAEPLASCARYVVRGDGSPRAARRSARPLQDVTSRTGFRVAADL